jgi:hypothetical protein
MTRSGADACTIITASCLSFASSRDGVRGLRRVLCAASERRVGDAAADSWFEPVHRWRRGRNVAPTGLGSRCATFLCLTKARKQMRLVYRARPGLTNRALYAARIEDLTHAQTVSVSAHAPHKAEIPVTTIAAKLPGWYRVSELSRVLRCRVCRAIGNGTETGGVRVDARQALGYAPPSSELVNGLGRRTSWGAHGAGIKGDGRICSPRIPGRLASMPRRKRRPSRAAPIYRARRSRRRAR